MTPRLSDAHERFCRQYLLDLNATAAYQRTYPASNAKSARTNGARLLAKAGVAARVAELQAIASVKLDIKLEDVLERLWDIATADPNELIELRRGCCRYCHGVGHGYQRTAIEKATTGDGGDGYDARKPPHPECPECHGEGIERVFPRDTRTLSRAARRLYAGVKQTKDGLEIKMHDQQAALETVGKHVGLKAQGAPPAGDRPVQVLIIGDQRIEF